jgi:hypothetical protein
MSTNQQLTNLIAGRKVESVRQRDTELDIDFADGSTLTIKLAAPAHSIKLVDSDDQTEYSA